MNLKDLIEALVRLREAHVLVPAEADIEVRFEGDEKPAFRANLSEVLFQVRALPGGLDSGAVVLVVD